MKTIASVVSAIAVVNLMAILMAAGWLWQSGRLNGERVQKVREIFSTTIQQEKDQLAEEEKQKQQQEQQAEKEKLANRPPLTAEQQLASLQFDNEQIQLNIERTRNEAETLKSNLQKELAAISRERKQLADERAAFKKMQEDIRKTRESDQFEKTLAVYQTLDPAQVKKMWDSLLKQGKMTQVVTYLDAMQSRKAAAVIEEFAKENPDLAAELLQNLRTHGFSVAASEEGK